MSVVVDLQLLMTLKEPYKSSALPTELCRLKVLVIKGLSLNNRFAFQMPFVILGRFCGTILLSQEELQRTFAKGKNMPTYPKAWKVNGAIIRQRGCPYQVETHHNGKRARQTFKTVDSFVSSSLFGPVINFDNFRRHKAQAQ
jgi:hypothetical protein